MLTNIMVLRTIKENANKAVLDALPSILFEGLHISIWFQIKRTQPKVLASRTCCSDVGYARYFIALFSFRAGTAYHLLHTMRS